ncbi:hypothetical protein CGLO_08614 [Colletotrichum gloeosporioides Cg-14]|uniref:Uncharacterized protein n=1 Tax=Colletotrichum gloeosporioides (strain Cg-14) TaxID=1237896 RepID=T0KFQ1_COLGC|nr:hypothetical protein CGLO_08614 [Colletotrichum gloeosporioides Cg-14]
MPPDYLRAYGRFVEAIKVAVNEYNLSSGEVPLKFVGPILTPDNKIGEVRIVRDTEQEEDEDSEQAPFFVSDEGISTIDKTEIYLLG